MIFQAEDHVAFLGVLERALDAVGGAGDALVEGEARVLLAAERAAMSRTRPDRQVDCEFLPLDFPEPFVAIGVREVR